MIDFAWSVWNGIPAWSQVTLVNLVLIIIIVLPVVLGVAYLTFAERKIRNNFV